MTISKPYLGEETIKEGVRILKKLTTWFMNDPLLQCELYQKGGDGVNQTSIKGVEEGVMIKNRPRLP